jgi:hypothetical protein
MKRFFDYETPCMSEVSIHFKRCLYFSQSMQIIEISSRKKIDFTDHTVYPGLQFTIEKYSEQKCIIKKRSCKIRT